MDKIVNISDKKVLKDLKNMLLLYTNQELFLCKKSLLNKKELKQFYRVIEWDYDTLMDCLIYKRSLFQQRRDIIENFNNVKITWNEKTKKHFDIYLDEYIVAKCFNLRVTQQALAFCMIEGIMNQILDYSVNDGGYIDFHKRWKVFEKNLFRQYNNHNHPIKKKKFKTLYNSIRNKLLHGEAMVCNNSDLEYLEELLFSLLKLDISNKKRNLISDIERKSIHNLKGSQNEEAITLEEIPIEQYKIIDPAA